MARAEQTKQRCPTCSLLLFTLITASNNEARPRMPDALRRFYVSRPVKNIPGSCGSLTSTRATPAPNKNATKHIMMISVYPGTML